MEPWLVGMIQFFTLIFVALSGVPISIAMGILGYAFACYHLGFSAASSLTGITAYHNVAHFSVAMIPMFVVMGTVCASSGIGRDAYDCIYAWLGRVKGSIGIVSVLSCAMFAALTGSSTATVVTIGSFSIPEMKRRGYDKKLYLGTICVAGTLGILIPPSMIMIFYGILTEVSIGKLFIGGIIPGIISAFLFSALIYIRVSLNPSLAPVSDVFFTLKEKVLSTVKIVPIILIFLVVIIGIYEGFFSPEEAAGVGAFATVIVGVVMGRLNWNKFKSAIKDSLKITGFIMLIIMAAMLFAHSIALSGFSNKLYKVITTLDAPPIVIMLVIILVYVGLGCVMDTFGMMVLTVPIFFPTVVSLGYDPVWFGVLVTVLVEVAIITPPIGTNIYVTKSLDKDSSSWDVIQGMVPFFWMELVVIALMLFFPDIVLWLPSKMVK